MDTLLLPLSWWDMFPHQLAHSNEDAWARGLQVTREDVVVSWRVVIFRECSDQPPVRQHPQQLGLAERERPLL